MKSHPDRWVPLERLQKPQVGLLVGALQHFFKVADGLMPMDNQNELEFWQVGCLVEVLQITANQAVFTGRRPDIETLRPNGLYNRQFCMEN